jgi:hypothetical protein
MSTYYGKNGRLRIYDSTKGRDLSQSAPIRVRVLTESGAVFTNITSNALDPLAGTNTILPVSTDHVYFGNLFPFSRIAVDVTTPASADGGAIVVEYWNGSAWTQVSSVDDTTKVGVNTLRQDGDITWEIPTDWVANDPPTAGTSLYYVRIHTTTSTGTDAVVQLLEPASGQYYEVVFENMNLQAPEGSNRPEEIIRMNRGRLDANSHYIQGLDDPIVAPHDITFSAWLDSVYNKSALPKALSCEATGLDTWPLVGVSTKGDSQLPAGLTGTLVNTPLFTDPTKKAVCIQAKWEDVTGSSVFREYNEVHIPSGGVTLTEAPDSVTLNLTGGIYGSIRDDLVNFGYRN